jgi:hypothetical protein
MLGIKPQGLSMLRKCPTTKLYLQPPVCLFMYLFYLGETGVWTQGFAFTKQVLLLLSHASSTFCSGYFGDGGL